MTFDPTQYYDSIPSGRLGLIPLQSCMQIGNRVNDFLVEWRSDREFPSGKTLHHE